MKTKSKAGYFLSILILLFFVSFKSLTNPLYIKGHLKPKENKQKIELKGLTVFVKADGKIVAKTHADKNGDFELTFTPEKEKSFDFYCSGTKIGTVLLKSFHGFESDNVEMDFHLHLKKSKPKK